jgi:Flp pilus assembly protein TadD
MQREPEGARGDLDEILRQQPSDAWALNCRAWLRVARGDLAGGREDAEKALAAHPDWAPALGSRCFALAGLGDFQGARRDCSASLKISPNNSIELGMLAFLDGHRDEALRFWNGAGEATPFETAALEPWIAKASGH